MRSGNDRAGATHRPQTVEFLLVAWMLAVAAAFFFQFVPYIEIALTAIERILTHL